MKSSFVASFVLAASTALVLSIQAFAIDLKAAQPAKPMQPVQPAKPGLPGKVQPVQAADLMVVPGSLRWRTPPVVGQPSSDGRFQYTVQNIGGASVNPNVRITCTGVSGSPPCSRQMTGNMTLGEMSGAGGMNARQTNLWPPPPGGTDPWQAGIYEIRVQAVAGRGQVERNTSNNVQTLRFTVTGNPPAPGSAAGIKVTTPLQAKGINPQPEPPHERSTSSGITLPGQERAFQPQPEPPGRTSGSSKIVLPGSERAFQPQPEPPGRVLLSPTPPSGPAGINPHPEPPKPLPTLAEDFRAERLAVEEALPQLKQVPGRQDLADRIAAELEEADKTMVKSEAFWRTPTPKLEQGMELRNQLDMHKTRIDTFQEELKKGQEERGTGGDDAQLANIELQNMIQKQQQLIQMLSNVSKALTDTSLAVKRKIG